MQWCLALQLDGSMWIPNLAHHHRRHHPQLRRRLPITIRAGITTVRLGHRLHQHHRRGMTLPHHLRQHLHLSLRPHLHLSLRLHLHLHLHLLPNLRLHRRMTPGRQPRILGNPLTVSKAVAMAAAVAAVVATAVAATAVAAAVLDI